MVTEEASYPSVRRNKVIEKEKKWETPALTYH